MPKPSPRGVGPLLVLLLACRPGAPAGLREFDELAGRTPDLPTGVTLDPEGDLLEIGQFPLAMVSAPGDRVVLLLNGYRDQGIQVVDRATGRVLQTVLQPAAFLGLAFSPDGRTLWASGGNQDVVYRYDWRDGVATLRDSAVLALKPDPNRSGTRYPAGVAPSPDGRYLYVAENLADSLAVVDAATGTVTLRLPSGRYPYGVAVRPDGVVYVSAWGGSEVTAYGPAIEGGLVLLGRIPVGRHPSALLLNADGSRLFVASGSTDRVAVVDTRAGRVVAELRDPAPAGPDQGSTPNALALSDDGTRLYVAEADNNAVAVFDLSAATSGVGGAAGRDRLTGRIPAGWYPTALLARGDSLLVVNAKGRGTRANPRDGPGPHTQVRRPPGYTLASIGSTLMISARARADSVALAPLSRRVARANNWDRVRAPPSYPPFRHVVYIIKENRTYDQVFGDMPGGDGDTSLVFFPRPVSPNHHALADRFGLYDRFFVNAEVSPDGHNWSMAAYTTDYLQKTVPSNYSGRGRTYDWEGTNRGEVPEDDVAEPAGGYLWDLAERKGVTFRNFGEFVMPVGVTADQPTPTGYRGLKPFLAANTDSSFPAYDLRIPDQVRADIWLRALAGWAAGGAMPRLQIVRLPNDHTYGARAGELTPKAYMADNDLALGRMIEGLSRSPFWRNTVVFVLEDDAQNGPDHVDSHRSVLLVISPYNRPGAVHRWVNTTDVLLTIEEILGLDQLSQFDWSGRPLRGIWASRPDLRPYAALLPTQPLTERNPAGGPGAKESEGLDFRFEDVAEEDAFNLALWLAIMGPRVPYPGPTRMSALEARRTSSGLSR
jgi:YVTN family beta-propeller protein